MATNLIIGCPVWKRDWILPSWFQYNQEALNQLEFEWRLEYIFVVNEADKKSISVIEKSASMHPVKFTFLYSEKEQVQDGRRIWNIHRYRHMAYLRNLLLHEVRAKKPDYFFSLDSDILMASKGLKSLFKNISPFDAIGAKCYMTPTNTAFPSNLYFGENGKFKRNETNKVIETEVIMAAKLMTPKAYNVDYEAVFGGEDIGWSKNATKIGLKLGWDGTVVNKHVMAPEFLDQIDPRCGF